MKLLKDFKYEDVIHCSSPEIWIQVLTILIDHKILRPSRWTLNDWTCENFVIFPTKDSWDCVDYCNDQGYNIIPAEEFLKANDPNYNNESYTLI